MQSKLALFLIALALAAAATAGPASADELKLAIIVTRHGVRSPLYKDEDMVPYAARPWPRWEVGRGQLTPRGNLLVGLMAAYYRERFLAAGLLTGDAGADEARIYLKADNDQRTIDTARTLGRAFLPGQSVRVWALPTGTVDPLFQPLRAHIGHADAAKGRAAVLGRLGGDPSVLDRAYAPQFALLKGILYGADAGTDAAAATSGSRPTPFDVPAFVGPGEYDNVVSVRGPLRAALVSTESLLLEYLDGKPAADVGWGRVDAAVLTQLLALHDLYFDLVGRTFYPAQVQGSNLASHLVATLKQGATGRAVPGAIGPLGARVVVVAGHDTNLANLGGLLGLSWWIQGSQSNPVLPGSALIFELWHRAGPGGGDRVRISYVAQTLEQMRAAEPLSLARPPVVAPVFMARCGGASPTFDAPWAEFEQVASEVIDPSFVVAGAP
jgi:4-phytase/acid phosphatase